MADVRAQELVNQLERRGLSRAAIGRAIGRDSGMVSQIARGTRGPGYGAGLVQSLEQLAGETGRATSVHQAQGIASGLAARGDAFARRRTTKSGRTASVRRKTQTVGANTARERTGGSLSGTGAGTGATVARHLDRALRTHQRVSMRIEIENNTGPGTRWITISDQDAATWRYLLGLAGDDATMRERLQHALDELAENGDLTSDVSVTGAHQLNVEAV